jgi:hypothetical protein
MFNFFKTVEKLEEQKQKLEEQKQKAEKEKLDSLNRRVKSLNHSHSVYRHKLLYVPGGRYEDDNLVEFSGFYIENGEIRVNFRDSGTAPGVTRYWKWDQIVFLVGEDAIEKWHNRYRKLQSQFNLLGVELVDKPKEV